MGSETATPCCDVDASLAMLEDAAEDGALGGDDRGAANMSAGSSCEGERGAGRVVCGGTAQLLDAVPVAFEMSPQSCAVSIFGRGCRPGKTSRVWHGASVAAAIVVVTVEGSDSGAARDHESSRSTGDALASASPSAKEQAEADVVANVVAVVSSNSVPDDDEQATGTAALWVDDGANARSDAVDDPNDD